MAQLSGKQIKDTSVKLVKLDNAGSQGTTLFGTGTMIAITDAPTIGTDLANKNYVDSVAQGLDVKQSVQLATTGPITLSGEQTIDGVLTSTSRVLVKNQGTASQNGIYVTGSGAWTRATDADASSEVTAGMFMFVTEGNTLADTGWVLITNDPITLGTTGLEFTQFTGTGQITAGAGLSKTGDTINVGDVNRGVQVNADDLEIDGSEIASTGLEEDATNSWQIRLAAQGNGIAGGSGTTLSVDPATEVADTRAAVYVAADGVGINLDGTSLTHSSSTLSVKDDGITAAKLNSDVAGAGLVQNGVSGAIDVANATNGGITVNANSIQLNFNDLASATFDPANDSLPIMDATDNSSKLESWVDIASAIAGNGLSATNGVLAVDQSEATEAAIDVAVDYITFLDGGASGTLAKESVADLIGFVAGTQSSTGLTASSGVLTTGSLEHQRATSFTSSAGNNSTTGISITNTPSADSDVQVYVNGALQVLGDGVKTEDCYFSGDGGTNARAISAIVGTDVLYWNGVISGFDIVTGSDEVDVVYYY